MRLKDFAEKLGLSPTTVSRALAGYPEVREKTRQRVLKEASRFGYRPNSTAVRLATGKAGAIGIIFDRSLAYQTAEFITGVGRALVARECEMLIAPVASGSQDSDIEMCDRLAKGGRVDAVILSSPLAGDARLASLLEQGVPFLTYGQLPECSNHAWFDIDSVGLAKLATEHLLDLAHQRIALINGPQELAFSSQRHRGYREALAERALPYDTEIVANGDLTDEKGFALGRSFFEQHPRPTAVVTGSTTSALGVYRAAKACGLIVGRDVSVVAHDDRLAYLRAEHMSPTLSATRSSLHRAGMRAGELILELLAGRPANEIHELWPVNFVRGQSTDRHHGRRRH